MAEANVGNINMQMSTLLVSAGQVLMILLVREG